MSTVSIIGTRDPGAGQFAYAEGLARGLSRDHGVKIRTGGAYGIDQAAMTGAKKSLLEIFLPWPSYNREIIPPDAGLIVTEIKPEWLASVDKYHPNPAALSRGARALHARNYPLAAEVDLVIAFPNEKGAGGTSQGMRIARDKGVPVLQFNKNAPLPTFVSLLQRVLEELGPA
jgi:predicted Rossmann-fold nucleotide-binding protein